MTISTVYPYRGVLRSASGSVLEERGFFSLHSARKAVVNGCISISAEGERGVSGVIYRGQAKVSEFSVLDQGAT
jgi:hypothetical protein